MKVQTKAREVDPSHLPQEMSFAAEQQRRKSTKLSDKYFEQAAPETENYESDSDPEIKPMRASGL